MDQVIIRDLLVRGRTGISADERKRPQDILINIRVGTDISAAAQSDDIRDCIDYSVLTKGILALAEENQKKTLEALTSDIADLCLSHPLAVEVTVRCEKTSAVRFTAGTGIEITRKK